MGKKKRQRQPKYQQGGMAPPRKRHTPPPPLKPRNERQARLLSNLKHHQLNFALGPAGTGKTYCAARHACQLFQDGHIDKIIVTRPMVTSEEDPGYLPGDLGEKYAPYFAPVREILEEHLGPGPVEYFIKSGQIQIAPLAFLRGWTFKNCFVLFDECQNTTEAQMKLFLTRIGEGAQICLAGDESQVDEPYFRGLTDAFERFGDLPEAGVVRFLPQDVTRSGLARKIVQGYLK